MHSEDMWMMYTCTTYRRRNVGRPRQCLVRLHTDSKEVNVRLMQASSVLNDAQAHIFGPRPCGGLHERAATTPNGLFRVTKEVPAEYGWGRPNRRMQLYTLDGSPVTNT